MLRLLALPLAVVALGSYESSVRPLPAPLEQRLDGRFWQPGCPVPLSDLRLLTVTHWGFDGREHTGQLVVHRDSAKKLQTVFRKLHALEFPDPAHAARRHVRAATRTACGR